FAIASLLAFLTGIGGIVDGVHAFDLTRLQQILLLGTLLLTARAQISGLFLLTAMFLSYVVIHHKLLAPIEVLPPRLLLLASPWRLATFGLSMVLLTQSGRWFHQKTKGILTGPFAQRFFMAPSIGWIFWPATLLCTAAAFYHTFDPNFREVPRQLLT